MAKQKIIHAVADFGELEAHLKETGVKRLFLVCGASLSLLRINRWFEAFETQTGVKLVRFSDFSPNPTYGSVVEGVQLFLASGCDAVMAVGGGSAMDVAKCIKLFAKMDQRENYLTQTIVPNDIPLIVMPTTAGTGSEATRYAVIYYAGEKQTVTDCSCIPGTVLFDVSALTTLPGYQKKATMLDALCHAIESYWSVNSTAESRRYSKEAIEGVLCAMEGYLSGTDAGCAAMLYASNTAGKAINITQTTAGHAMCYKLTSLYGIAHGHAAAMCVAALWPWMLSHTPLCADQRGEAYLTQTFRDIAAAMHALTPEAAAEKFDRLLTALELPKLSANAEEVELLRASVNPERLKNHPVRLDMDSIRQLYHTILTLGER